MHLISIMQQKLFIPPSFPYRMGRRYLAQQVAARMASKWQPMSGRDGIAFIDPTDGARSIIIHSHARPPDAWWCALA